MIKEKSCGAVVYKYENGQLAILIEKMQKGHYSMPKGHVENDETEVQTATREIKEETNLDVAIDANFRKVITFSPYDGCMKDVVFFVAEVTGGDMINQECEVSGLLWLAPQEAINIITHDTDRDVLISAIEYIESKATDKNERQ